MEKRAAFLRASLIENNRADVTHIGVDGKAEHEQLDDGDKERKEHGGSVAQHVEDFFFGNRQRSLDGKWHVHGPALMVRAREIGTKTASRLGSGSWTSRPFRPRSSRDGSASTRAWIDCPKIVASLTWGSRRRRSRTAATLAPAISR